MSSKLDADNMYNKGEYDKAIALYSMLIENKTDDIYKLLSNRSLAYFKLKNYNMMVKDCIETVKLKKDSAKSWGRLGGALYGLMKYEESLQAYTKASKLELCYMMRRKYNLMISSNKKLLELKSKDEDILHQSVNNISPIIENLFSNKELFLKVNDIASKININLQNTDLSKEILHIIQDGKVKEIISMLCNKDIKS